MTINILLLSCPLSHPRAIGLGKALSRRGHKVTVVSATRGRRFTPQIVRGDSNLNVVYLPGLRNNSDYAGYLMRLPFYGSFFSAPFDLIHFLTPSQPYALLGTMTSKAFGRVTGTKVVVDWDEPWGGSGLGREHGSVVGDAMDILEKTTLRSAGYLTLGSRLLARELATFARNNSVRQVIHNGNTVSTIPQKTEARRLLGIDEDCLVLIYQGNYTTPNYLRMLKQSYKELSAINRKFCLCLLGGGKWNASEFQAQRHGSIIAKERIPVSELEVFHGAADIALLPLEENVFDSYRYPLRLSDYLFAGLPIVATQVGESGLVIRENNCGLLSDANDPAGFAENLKSLAVDEDLRNSLGANARRAALTGFTWDVGASKAEQLYLEALNGASASQNKVVG